MRQYTSPSSRGGGIVLALSVRALQGNVYGLAVRVLWCREDAEDATQEILIRIITPIRSGLREALMSALESAVVLPNLAEQSADPAAGDPHDADDERSSSHDASLEPRDRTWRTAHRVIIDHHAGFGARALLVEIPLELLAIRDDRAALDPSAAAALSAQRRASFGVRRLDSGNEDDQNEP